MFPMRCRCGQLEGQLTFTERAGRAVCYCRDCQAFARFLGNSERILNELAGTDLFPRDLRTRADIVRWQLKLRSSVEHALMPKGSSLRALQSAI